MGTTMDKLKGKMKKAEGEVQEKKGDVEGAFARAKRRAQAKIDEAKAKRAAKKATR
jgi:hypothetical protein